MSAIATPKDFFNMKAINNDSCD